MSRRLPALIASLAIGVGASFGLAACGDDDGDGGDDGATETVEQQGTNNPGSGGNVGGY